MPPCNSQHHPQVPQTYASVFLSYCHQCSAFTLHESLQHYEGNEDMVNDRWEATHFGPLDTPEDVMQAAAYALERLVMTAGRPWDHQHPTGELLLFDDERPPSPS